MKILLNNAPEKSAKLLRNVANKAAEFLGQPENLGLVATFTGKDEICELNTQYRGVERATDVLSFPTIDNLGHGIIDVSLYPYETDLRTGILNLGDVFICTDIAKEQAQEYGHSIEREYAFLFLHGLLHLLGFDHIEHDDEREMNATAQSILSACGIER